MLTFAPGVTGSGSAVVALSAVLLVGASAFATVAYVPRARSLVERERERTATERDAFVAFASEVSSLDASLSSARREPSSAAGGTARLAGTDRGGGSQTRRIVRAYRDTVLAVDHRDSVEESLARNLAAELGTDLAAPLLDGATVSPQLQAALARRARAVADTRDSAVTELDREADALADAERTLDDVASDVDELGVEPARRLSFEALFEEWTRLGDVQSRVEALLDDRQRDLHARDGSGNLKRGLAFVYGPLPVRHPVLAAGVELANRIREARETRASRLTWRS
ncbi:MAG: hypothetical protein ABEJ68_06855 [Halobacteriaceae archaeon]